MANDISGFGLQIHIKASETFPTGFNVTQFADDADAFDAPDLTITESAMGLNGDLVTWNVANPPMVTIGVVPGGADDINLEVLLEANRVGKGKQSARDLITMAVVHPNESTVTYTGGKITNGQHANSIASAGRMKSKTYGFTFENKAVTRG